MLTLTQHLIRHSLLITHGIIRDYQNPDAEEIPFTKVATSNTALELMLRTGKDRIRQPGRRPGMDGQ